MQFFAYIICVMWLPICVGIFLAFEPVRAMIVCAVTGFLFLPQFSLPMHFVPYTKATMIPLGIIAGVLFGDTAALRRFRFSWIDVPAVMVALVPLASGLHNGFSPYDSAAGAATNCVTYSVLYFLGRIYLRDSAAVWRFAMAMFYAGIIYLPLCVAEMRLGPWFHFKIYGFEPIPDYSQSIRDGGYRPIVFMQHGLMLGMLMGAAALCGLWLWACKALPRTIAFMPAGFWAVALVIVTVLCHSTGATILMMAGLVVLLAARKLKSHAPVIILAALPLMYMTARIELNWSGQNFVAFVGKYVGAERAASLQTRLENEKLLLDKAMMRPILGWGPMGKQQIVDEENPSVLKAIPDGMWEANLGAWGFIGLAGAYGLLMLPALVFLWRYPARSWGLATLAAPEVLAVICLLYALDNLMNNMVNPLFYLAMGAVANAAMMPRASRVSRAVVSGV